MVEDVNSTEYIGHESAEIAEMGHSMGGKAYWHSYPGIEGRHHFGVVAMLAPG